jgi:hypothetical protein
MAPPAAKHMLCKLYAMTKPGLITKHLADQIISAGAWFNEA